ncbi:MAG: hypothetical protein IPL88_15315 [Rhizobiales bacterium]|nr:hypothetical protein [Hyphomicrobiales bacterium]
MRRDETDYERRTFVNLVVTILLLVYALAFAWTLLAFGRYTDIERCVASGRSDCVQLPTPPRSVLLLPNRGG